MREWLWRPGVLRVGVALASILALAGGFFGASWFLERTRPSAAGAAEQAAPAPATAEPSGPIVINGTGDVNLDGSQLGLVRGSFDAPWTGVRDLFTTSDLTIVNLECSPGRTGEAEDKSFTFRCPGGFEEMRANGVDVANLGNNHSLDFGKQAMLEGRAALEAAGVAPVGAGRDAAEANAPATFERKGKTIAVLGFGGVVPTPGWIAGPSHPGVSDGYDTASMARAVRAAAKRADIVVVSVHWGDEKKTEPNADDVARAHAMIDAGADVIFGHHPHVLQPLRWYGGRPIFFSLGNFVWPTGGPTAVGQAVFEPDGNVRACFLPARISGGRPVLDDRDARC